MKKTKVFVTTYALTKGIEEKDVEVKQSHDGKNMFWENGLIPCYEKNDFFFTREEALNYCENARRLKIELLKVRIKSFENSIAKLEKITF